MEWLQEFDLQQARQLIRDQGSLIFWVFLAGAVQTLWLLISGVALTRWAVETRFGWRRLKYRRVRENYLQLPVVLILFAATYIVLPNAFIRCGEVLLGQKEASQAVILVSKALACLIMAAATIALARWVFVGGVNGFGLRGRAVHRDILAGLGYFLAILPWVMVVLELTLWLFENLGITPTPHPILKLVSETHSRLIVNLSAFAAVVAAPLWEEVFFRGIVQSFWVRFFRVMMPPKGFPTMALPFSPPEVRWLEAQEAIDRARALGEQPPIDMDVPPEPESAGGQIAPLSPTQEAGRAVAAIILTSLIFASAHAATPSSIPAIFVLALALGYVYEKTGSLVCTITMHVLFNGLNMLVLLLQQGSPSG